MGSFLRSALEFARQFLVTVLVGGAVLFAIATLTTPLMSPVEKHAYDALEGPSRFQEFFHERESARLQEQAAQLEAISEYFKDMPINYNRPETLEYRKANRLVLSVGSASQTEALNRVARGEGPTRTVEVRLSDRVRAVIDGPPDLVDIELVDSDGSVGAVKSVNSQSNATWTWYVTPKTLEEVTLTLSIYNVAILNGEAVLIEGPAYSDTFSIRAPWWQKVMPFFTGFWGILIGLGGLTGFAVLALEIVKLKKGAHADLGQHQAGHDPVTSRGKSAPKTTGQKTASASRAPQEPSEDPRGDQGDPAP